MGSTDKLSKRETYIKELTRQIETDCQNLTISDHIDYLSKLLFKGTNDNAKFYSESGFSHLAYMFHLDAISNKMYRLDGDTSSTVELENYQGEDGYFNKLFEIASKLICMLINAGGRKKWNIILKMDAHNSLSGPSVYSLTRILDNGLIDYDIHKDSDKSKAYELFFLYNQFCKEKAQRKNTEFNKEDIFTIHRDFTEQKSIRSLAYQINKTNQLIKFCDGKDVGTQSSSKVGVSYYFDFLRCILNNNLDNENSDFKNFCQRHRDRRRKLYLPSPQSFAFFNLGISGFESWGTLMIEALEGESNSLLNCFYHIKDENDRDSEEELEDSKLLGVIKNIISALKKVDDDYNEALNKQKIKQESIKSAKAAIMSRNMSHNIGSHVMSYLKQHLGSVKDIIADGILSDLINGENELAKKLENTTENTTLPFLMGLGQFISYLQERQDFIATISTDYIPYFGNVNFKDAIYDELNPDKRAERHSERTNGKTNNILLGNIARSEGLGRKTAITSDKESNVTESRDIILKFREHFNGDKVVEIDENGNEKEILNQDAYDELNEMRKYDFSLPGGIVGRQAIFSIMENIIRNAAKHGNWHDQDNLEFTFDIFTNKKEDMDRLPINDNVNDDCLCLKEVIERFYANASDAKDLYFVTITDNCEIAPISMSGEPNLTSLGKLRNALTSNYINNAGEMENENKGLKEMRISAAWMRAIKDESMCFSPFSHVGKDTKYLECDKNVDTTIWRGDNVGQKAPLVYARVSTKREIIEEDAEDAEEEVTGRNLQFIFCIQIPKKVAIILNNNEKDIKTIKDNLEKINWRAYTVDEFTKERNKSYEFILIDDQCDNIEKTYFDIRSGATSRTYRISDIKDLNRNDFINRIKGANYDGKKDLILLYKSLSDYQEGDMIAIDDKIASKRNKDFKNVHIILKDGIDEKIKYIYCRHHDSDREFTDFMRSQKKDSALFVEGISGNNSTDRLVRNETLNDSWFYRHLRAMKQQIAVFDERLFSKITKLNESSYNDSEVAICKDNTALSYLQRGIYPFTFIADKNNKEIKLIGILQDNGNRPLYDDVVVKEDPQSPIHHYKCHCGCIACITFKTNKIEIVFNTNGEYAKKCFHSITIHQGLLDKIYELFEIKGNSSEKVNKEIITTSIFDTFCCKKKIVLGEGDSRKEFLPGIIIHSGRSKPNESDMPQKLPFIQYAALEHAVMDCKYSLVELLDYARYES